MCKNEIKTQGKLGAHRTKRKNQGQNQRNEIKTVVAGTCNDVRAMSFQGINNINGIGLISIIIAWTIKVIRIQVLSPDFLASRQNAIK